MKHLVFIFILLIPFLYCNAQEHETVLNSPEDWAKEIIHFPMGFAPEIPFKGFEDLRFTPGWKDTTGDYFFTYMFVWQIDSVEINEKVLSQNFNWYYDGLMQIDHQNKRDSSKTNQLDKTISIFIKSETGYSGKMRVFDNFFTKEYMVLNVKVTEFYCTETQQISIRCDISTQEFDHPTWDLFQEVQLKDVCEK